MGGPQMAEAGMEVREDLTKQALIGFWEVLKHYPWIKKRFDQCVQWLEQEKPDLLFLVDYPGFNLRLAQKAKSLGIPVCYYVAPQVWAWHKSRITLIRQVVRKLLVILPFEEKFFLKEKVPAVYVGNPLLEEINFKKMSRLKAMKRSPSLQKNLLGNIFGTNAVTHHSQGGSKDVRQMRHRLRFEPLG